MPLKVIIKKNEYDEYEVPTQFGLTGADQICFEDDKEAANDTARYAHRGFEIRIVHQRGTYTVEVD